MIRRSLPFVIGVLCTLTACRNSGDGNAAGRFSGLVFGDSCRVTYHDPSSRDLSAPIDSLLRTLEASLSLLDPNSAVSRFNGSEGRSGDPHLVEIVRQCQRIWVPASGAFDPTVLPLEKAWGISPAGDAPMDTMHLDSLDALVSLPSLHIEGTGGSAELTRTRPGVQIDPTLLGNGYAVDRIASLLEQGGVANYLIRVGDVYRARGSDAQGGAWMVGEPAASGTAADSALALKDRAMAGTHGRRLIDPRTGRPCTNSVKEVRVLHAQASVAQAVAHALHVLGLQGAREWTMREGSFPALVLVSDGQGVVRSWATPNWPGPADFKGEKPIPVDEMPAVNAPASAPNAPQNLQNKMPAPGKDPAKTKERKEPVKKG